MPRISLRSSGLRLLIWQRHHHGPPRRHARGAVALKQEAQHDLSPTEKLETQQWSKAGTAAQAAPNKAERRAEAKAKGYEGEMCSECGNFTRDSSTA